jgi:hypothetical protein
LNGAGISPYIAPVKERSFGAKEPWRFQLGGGELKNLLLYLTPNSLPEQGTKIATARNPTHPPPDREE